MALKKVAEILKEADKNKYAVAGFIAFNYESIAWLIEAAEEENKPAIVMLYPGMSGFIPMSTFAAITRDLAAKVKVPVGLHLDHGNSFEEILRGIKDGFTSVMIDGSSLSFEENVRITAEVVEAAHALGVDVEAELGHVGSASNPSDFANKENYTDIQSAVSFIEKTKVDSLAIAIGSAHGNYAATPQLDFKRLSEIKSAAGIPLVLHGGTGIPDEQIRQAVALGINKINIGTEYLQTFYRIVNELVSQKKAKNMYDCLKLSKPLIKDYIRRKIHLLEP